VNERELYTVSIADFLQGLMKKPEELGRIPVPSDGVVGQRNLNDEFSIRSQ
jgi:hypothetical protein